MKIKEIQNGSLYYNVKKDEVQRVRSAVNSQSVMVTHHDSGPTLSKATDLRIASDEEVKGYLES